MAEACGVTDPPPGDAPDPPLCGGAHGGKARGERIHHGGPPIVVWMMISCKITSQEHKILLNERRKGSFLSHLLIKLDILI